MNTIIKHLRHIIHVFLVDHYPHIVVNRMWPKFFGTTIDWKNPKDLNEKIQWLMCFSDTSEWTRLADKYRVREYIQEKGLENLLPKLYGKWDRAEDIVYEQLPDKFVLKCNHDCGSVHIIDKTIGFNKEEINKDLNKHVKERFGYASCEPHYTKIKPCIIAEEFLEEKNNSFSRTLVDYKVWCFDGKPYRICTYHNRVHKHVYISCYDLNWQAHPEYLIFSDHFRDGQNMVPRPKCFKEMLEAASTLSKGFPELRVDFYEVDGKLYFGELTFSCSAGKMDNFTEEFLIDMGKQIKLPINN